MSTPTHATAARNFYLIGHGCNDTHSIDKAMKQKVNGLECDLWADDEKKWWISHDGSDKTDLRKWLTYVGKSEQKHQKHLSIIIFDVKSAEPFVEVRELINELLPSSLPRIYSTAKIEDAHIFSAIVPLLQSHEGIAIDEEDDPKKVAAFFRTIGANQCWYGNGITLMIPINAPFHEAMQKAAPIRDTIGPFSKIYTWTVHRTSALRKYINEDKVDGIMVELNGFFTRPVTRAHKIIRKNKEIKLAERTSPLFQ